MAAEKELAKAQRTILRLQHELALVTESRDYWERSAAQWRERVFQWEETARNGIMDKSLLRKLLSLLHPDRAVTLDGARVMLTRATQELTRLL